VGSSSQTRWTIIEGAAAGRPRDREAFVRRYEPVVRAYLGARWRGSPLLQEVDDAAQEVFLDFFREGGALTRADRGKPGHFRTFLYRVVRNVALRVEERRARRRARRESVDLDGLAAREESAGQIFDRAWASALLRQAADLQAARARDDGPGAHRRVELLFLRFSEGLPIREIAARWGEDAGWVHHQYATARVEFRRALEHVVRAHDGGEPGDVAAECERLLDHFR